MKTKTKNKRDLYFKNYDLYSDANPRDTIRIKYKTLKDVQITIHKLEKLYKQKKYTHVRISQVTNVMTQRLRVLGKYRDKRYLLSNKYFEFLKKRTKLKGDKRYKYNFSF